MKLTRISVVSLLVVVVLLATAFTGSAAPAPNAYPQGSLQPQTAYDVHHDTSPALSSIAPKPDQTHVEKDPPFFHRLPGGFEGEPDSMVQRDAAPNAMPAPIANFEGLGNHFGGWPPDTQGEVGPNHYVQFINDQFAIYSKTGTLLYGPANGNTLWSGFGGACESSNDGDPITLYDQLTDRWVMTQFALPSFPNGPFYECIAVSASGDPTGSWHRYAFQTSANKMDDYPKLGVWPDGYYMSANLFTAGSLNWAGEGAYVFERDQMLTGGTARMVFFELGPTAWGGALPSDLDGMRVPPAGTPNIFVEVVDGAWDPPNWPNDALLLRAFHVDWTNTANSTYNSTPLQLPVASFDGLLCSFNACVPQPGTSQRLDTLSDRMMFRLAYRNMGTYESLVVNHTVDVGTDLAGIRWYELRDPWGTPAIYQQGTYAPADGLHRWMGSIAMDHVGNMAVGFSTSSSTAPNYPSIRYAGRLVTDPLGQMAQGEATLIAGGGSQTGANRWGDYSDMTVDPTDDCTFWYTTEYVPTTTSNQWHTRIGSFKFPSCNTLPTAVEVTAVTATPVTAYAPFALAGLALVAAAAVVLRLRARRA